MLAVLMVKWGRQYEIHMMLDHSQNHNKHKPDGLHARSMNAGFGRSQPKMHETKLLEGCVGEHPCTIVAFYEAKHRLESSGEADAGGNVVEEEEGGSNRYVSFIGRGPIEETALRVGDVQSMVYRETDPGPFYLSAEEREKQKHPRQTTQQVT